MSANDSLFTATIDENDDNFIPADPNNPVCKNFLCVKEKCLNGDDPPIIDGFCCGVMDFCGSGSLLNFATCFTKTKKI